MISWIMMGLGIGNAEVLVDTQLVGQQQGNFALDNLGTDTAAAQWLYTRSLLGYTGKARAFRYTFNLEVLGHRS